MNLNKNEIIEILNNIKEDFKKPPNTKLKNKYGICFYLTFKYNFEHNDIYEFFELFKPPNFVKRHTYYFTDCDGHPASQNRLFFENDKNIYKRSEWAENFIKYLENNEIKIWN